MVTRQFEKNSMIRCCAYDPKGAYIGKSNIYMDISYGKYGLNIPFL